jgi:hypothetical protein
MNNIVVRKSGPVIFTIIFPHLDRAILGRKRIEGQEEI